MKTYGTSRRKKKIFGLENSKFYKTATKSGRAGAESRSERQINPDCEVHASSAMVLEFYPVG